MTLTTKIVAADPANPVAVFGRAQELLGATGSTRWEHDQASGGSNACYRMEDGLGLPAWLWVRYGREQTGGRLLADENGRPDGYVEVSFDTSFGYRATSDGGREARAGDLHAWLVVELGQWLERAGVRWFWATDGGGDGDTWHEGPDRVRALLGNPAVGQPPADQPELF